MADAIFQQTVYDENDNELTCKYQAYHVQKNKWSDVHDTENYQYSINLGDNDWLTSDNSATNNNETVVIAFWVNGNDRTGLKDRFCAVKYNLDGSDVYAKKVKLIPKTAPDARLALPATAYVQELVTAGSNSSDVYQWTYESSEHRHTNTWFTQMFNSVGINTTQYDFGSGYEDENTHTYTSTGDYNVNLKVVNQYGLEDTTVGSIRIKNREPIVTLSNSPVEPIVNQDTTITVNTSDPSNAITEQKYYKDGVEVTDLTMQWSTLGTKEFKVITKWNDGFEDHTIETILHIILKNQPLTFTLTKEMQGEESENRYKFIISNLNDVDGDEANANSKWRIEYKVPVTNNWVVITTTEYPGTATTEPKEFVFEGVGSYRVYAIVKDEHGLETEESIDLEFSNGVTYNISKTRYTYVYYDPLLQKEDHKKLNAKTDHRNISLESQKLDASLSNKSHGLSLNTDKLKYNITIKDSNMEMK